MPGSGGSLGGENGNLLQYFCLGNPMDRNLVGYSLWGCKELDVTEHTHTHWRNHIVASVYDSLTHVRK